MPHRCYTFCSCHAVLPGYTPTWLPPACGSPRHVYLICLRLVTHTCTVTAFGLCLRLVGCGWVTQFCHTTVYYTFVTAVMPAVRCTYGYVAFYGCLTPVLPIFCYTYLCRFLRSFVAVLPDSCRYAFTLLVRSAVYRSRFCRLRCLLFCRFHSFPRGLLFTGCRVTAVTFVVVSPRIADSPPAWILPTPVTVPHYRLFCHGSYAHSTFYRAVRSYCGYIYLPIYHTACLVPPVARFWLPGFVCCYTTVLPPACRSPVPLPHCRGYTTHTTHLLPAVTTGYGYAGYAALHTVTIYLRVPRCLPLDYALHVTTVIYRWLVLNRLRSTRTHDARTVTQFTFTRRLHSPVLFTPSLRSALVVPVIYLLPFTVTVM